jgi:hypothetical protein
MSPLDRLIVRFDEAPLGPLFRGVMGFAAASAWLALPAWLQPNWLILPFFLAVLLSIRVGALFARRLFRFGPEVRAIWGQRRRTAKRYDSYQWQKLLWFAMGMWVAVWRADGAAGALRFLTYAALASGALGLSIWMYRSAASKSKSNMSESLGTGNHVVRPTLGS